MTIPPDAAVMMFMISSGVHVTGLEVFDLFLWSFISFAMALVCRLDSWFWFNSDEIEKKNIADIIELKIDLAASSPETQAVLVTCEAQHELAYVRSHRIEKS